MAYRVVGGVACLLAIGAVASNQEQCLAAACPQQDEDKELAEVLEAQPEGEQPASLNLLQRVARRGQGEQRQSDVCEVGAIVTCPGSGDTCTGDQCCPGTPETQNRSFPCPSASLTFTSCDEPVKVSNCVPCLCSFDIDRTLTSNQSDTNCSGSLELGIKDTAYGGGNLTLSSVGQSLKGTFCHGCHVAIVTAGDASGFESEERAELEMRLSVEHPSELTHGGWTGPSYLGENRANCSIVGAWNLEWTGTFAVGCADGTKQYAVEGIISHLERTSKVTILRENVWHFDDRADNILPFNGTGFNAREISCDSRARGGIGVCGAQPSELLPEVGVTLCPADLTSTTPPHRHRHHLSHPVHHHHGH